MEYIPIIAICPHGHQDTFFLYFSSDYASFSYICESCSLEQKQTPLKIIKRDGLTTQISVDNISCKCPKAHVSDEKCHVLIQDIPELDITEVFYYCNSCNLEYNIEILPEIYGLE